MPVHILNNVSIKQVLCYKHLGLIFNDKITWSAIVKIRRGNPRFDSIFYNNAPVLKKTFACPRLNNYFPSFLSSLYVRTTNIYWRNSSLFSTTHPTFLHRGKKGNNLHLQKHMTIQILIYSIKLPLNRPLDTEWILDDTSNFPPLVPIQEVNRAYFA
jgi:hypothetical protein